MNLLDTSSPSNNSESLIQPDLPMSVGIPSAINTDHAVSSFTNIHPKGNNDNDGSLKDRFLLVQGGYEGTSPGLLDKTIDSTQVAFQTGPL